MKIVPLCAIAAFALLGIGCEKPNSSSAGTVAVLDLDAVAKRLGRDVAISDQLKNENDTLVSKLTKSRDELQAKFDASRASIGDKPTDEQTQRLTQLGQSMNSELLAKQQDAQKELGAKQASLVAQFREEVKPVAQKAAAKKGMSIVLLRSDITVLSAEAAVDITDDVVAAMIGSGKSSGTPAPTATP